MANPSNDSHRMRLIGYSGALVATIVAAVMALGCADSHSNATGGNLPTVSEPVVPGIDPLDTLANAQMSGGPAPDGIPAIDSPRFFSSHRQADRFLDPGDIVFGIVRAGDARAYPQRILVWHEIVNDVVGGDNVAVTYCPLTGTAIGFKRGETTLGVSGMLVNSNLVMFDRATESRWPQVLGRAIEGAHRAERLQEVPVVWTTWARWREAYPDSKVLANQTGFIRNYNRDPYGTYNPRTGYYSDERILFPLLHEDDRLPRKAVVIGARTADGAIAFVKERLRSEGILHGEAGGVNYTALYHEPLDTAAIVRNPERKTLNLEDPFADPGMAGAERVNAFDAMWFAWHAFYPETTLVE